MSRIIGISILCAVWSVWCVWQPLWFERWVTACLGASFVTNWHKWDSAATLNVRPFCLEGEMPYSGNLNWAVLWLQQKCGVWETVCRRLTGNYCFQNGNVYCCSIKNACQLYRSLNNKYTIYYTWRSLKFTLKYTEISLLHVSVYDRHQGACTEPG